MNEKKKSYKIVQIKLMSFTWLRSGMRRIKSQS